MILNKVSYSRTRVVYDDILRISAVSHRVKYFPVMDEFNNIGGIKAR
jgi:hypothetical protein